MELAGRTAVVAGGGHNGLVAALLLQQRGAQVTVVEMNDKVGGACSSVRFPCGCVVSRGANALAMFPEDLRDDLGISFSVTPASPELAIRLRRGHDITWENVAAEPDVRPAQLEAAQRLLRDLDEAAARVARLWSDPFASGSRFREALSARPEWPARWLDGSIAELLDEFGVAAAPLRDLLVATSTLYPARTTDRGTAFPLLYLGATAPENTRSTGWGVVAGGMQAVADALEDALVSLGGKVLRSTRVTGVEVVDGRATGVVTERGELLSAELVVASVSPRTALWDWLEPGCASKAQAHVKTIDFWGGCAKLNLLLDRRAFAASAEAGERTPFFVMNTSPEELDSAFDIANAGELPDRPYLELMLPARVVPELSCGRHVPASVFALHLPRTVDSRQLARFRRIVLSELSRFFPSFRETVVWDEILGEAELAAEWGMVAGNVDHGAMSPGNRFASRGTGLVPAGATGIENYFLGGAGVHPGGLVSGLPGSNVVKTIAAASRG
jgi:phytoene dehydrogenase-like protein